MRFFVSVEETDTRYWTERRTPAKRKRGDSSLSSPDLVPASANQLIESLNARLRLPKFFQFILLAAIAVSLLDILVLYNLFSYADPTVRILPIVISAATLMFGLVAAFLEFKREQRTRTISLLYKLDNDTKDLMRSLYNALSVLGDSACVWEIVSSAQTWDFRRNAGASHLIDRNRVSVGTTNMPMLKAQFDVWAILLGGAKLFFLPDQVLMLTGDSYYPVPYDAITVQVSQTTFIEDGGVPRDSLVVGTTWRFVRKDGGPDLRFNNNAKIPKCRYAHLQLLISNGPEFALHVSNTNNAELFLRELSDYQSLFYERHSVEQADEILLPRSFYDNQWRGAPTAEIVERFFARVAKVGEVVDQELGNALADEVLEPLEIQSLLQLIDRSQSQLMRLKAEASDLFTGVQATEATRLIEKMIVIGETLRKELESSQSN